MLETWSYSCASANQRFIFLVRLFSELRTRFDIVTHIKNLVAYGFDVGSLSFLCVFMNWYSRNKQCWLHCEIISKSKRLSFKQWLRKMMLKIWNKSLLIEQLYVFRVSPFVNCLMELRATLVKLVAFCSSIKCFEYLIQELYLKSKMESRIKYLAIARGSYEDHRTVQNPTRPSCIKYAIRFHLVIWKKLLSFRKYG